jgi:hypothetical protein
MRRLPVAQIETEKRRWAILRHLYALPTREVSHPMLRDACRALGLVTTDDDLTKTAMRWLAENGLVTLKEAGPMLVARLTAAGDDVLKGFAQVDGILAFGDPV